MIRATMVLGLILALAQVLPAYVSPVVEVFRADADGVVAAQHAERRTGRSSFPTA